VQPLPSLHVAPFGLAVCMQAPVAGSHAAVWHGSLGVHAIDAPPHTPLALHVSPVVHADPSLHD
jgi:hypothetical protein